MNATRKTIDRSAKDLERFMAKVMPSASGACWEWRGHINHQGYGTFYADGKKIRAHRWAHEHWTGEIPEGLEIDHLCRTKACVNPEHLEAVTPRENKLRSDGFGGINYRKTECPLGHAYDRDNTRLTTSGRRRCKRCEALERRRLNESRPPRPSKTLGVLYDRRTGRWGAMYKKRRLGGFATEAEAAEAMEKHLKEVNGND